MKDIKIFLKKKKIKSEKSSERERDIKIKQKQKLREYLKKYYLAYKKVTITSF